MCWVKSLLLGLALGPMQCSSVTFSSSNYGELYCAPGSRHFFQLTVSHGNRIFIFDLCKLSMGRLMLLRRCFINWHQLVRDLHLCLFVRSPRGLGCKRGQKEVKQTPL